MVIVKLYGGLGNQMFQYAAGLALAERLRTSLYMDLSWFERVVENPELTLRVYELDGFGIIPTEMTLSDKINYRRSPPKVFKESSLDFNSAFKALGGSVILDGYWQSYKYFENYRSIILKFFSFPRSVTTDNRMLLQRIGNTDSVSVHIRRGDYNTKVGRSHHGLMEMAYYNKALSVIKKTVKEPTLYIFSDEIEWCKRNFKFSLPMVFIDSNGPNSGVEDMRLMSACEHNIIANSSFSWWAAWLNQNPGKKVIAPQKWFADPNLTSDDKIPPQWQRI